MWPKEGALEAMKTMKTIEELDQAFLQLEFAIKLMCHAELGRIDAEEFNTDCDIRFPKKTLSFISSAFSSIDEIILAAQNNCSIVTMGFTANCLDSVLTDVAKVNPSTVPQDLKDMVFMIRCAFAHPRELVPCWEARGPYAREYRLNLPSGPLVVDTRLLNGRPFQESDIGGFERYFEIKDEVRRLASLL